MSVRGYGKADNKRFCKTLTTVLQSSLCDFCTPSKFYRRSGLCSFSLGLENVQGWSLKWLLELPEMSFMCKLLPPKIAIRCFNVRSKAARKQQQKCVKTEKVKTDMLRSNSKSLGDHVANILCIKCRNRESRIHWRIHRGAGRAIAPPVRGPEKKLNVTENNSSDKKTNSVHVVRLLCAIPISRVFGTFTTWTGTGINGIPVTHPWLILRWMASKIATTMAGRLWHLPAVASL